MDNVIDSTALARREDQMAIAAGDIMPAVSIEQMIARYNSIVEFTKRVLKKGIDYGVIPGTERKGDDGTPSNKNNTLLKPGAEKLCTLFGLVSEFEDYKVVEDWAQGIFYYAFRCKLTRGGRVIATGIGSANSRERKYRRDSRTCPECGSAAIKKSKYPPKGSAEGTPPGWYCENKSGGCGRSFAADDKLITGQVATADPAAACDLINTLQKMAQKRAHVAATLYATNASEFFTQDAEDMEIIDAEFTSANPPGRTSVQVHPLADNEQFMEQVKLAAFDRAITAAELEAGFAATIKKMGKPLAELPVSAREAILAGIRSGKSDKWKTAAAGEAGPVISDEDKYDAERIAKLSAPEFRAMLREHAKPYNISRQVFEAGIAKYLAAIGPTASLGDLTGPARMELLECITANVFDYQAGKIPAAAGA